MAFGSCPSTWEGFCGSQMVNSGEEGTVLSPSAFYAGPHSTFGVAAWVVDWFLHMAPQLLHIQIEERILHPSEHYISLPRVIFCAFGLEARSPETLVLALTMTWVTSVGKSFWARPPEGFWCSVGCWNKMHNPDKCTASEPRMGFGRGNTLSGDVA